MAAMNDADGDGPGRRHLLPPSNSSPTNTDVGHTCFPRDSAPNKSRLETNKKKMGQAKNGGMKTREIDR